jgi:hypothetical protein
MKKTWYWSISASDANGQTGKFPGHSTTSGNGTTFGAVVDSVLADFRRQAPSGVEVMGIEITLIG